MPSRDPIGPPDIDLQGQQPELTDTQMLDWLIEAVNSTRLGAFIKGPEGPARVDGGRP